MISLLRESKRFDISVFLMGKFWVLRSFAVEFQADDMAKSNYQAYSDFHFLIIYFIAQTIMKNVNFFFSSKEQLTTRKLKNRLDAEPPKYKKFEPSSFRPEKSSMTTSKYQEHKYFSLKTSKSKEKQVKRTLCTKARTYQSQQQSYDKYQSKSKKQFLIPNILENDEALMEHPKFQRQIRLSFTNKKSQAEESTLSVKRCYKCWKNGHLRCSVSHKYTENSKQIGEMAEELKQTSINLQRQLIETQEDLTHWAYNDHDQRSRDESNKFQAEDILNALQVYINEVILKTTEITQRSYHLQSSRCEKQKYRSNEDLNFETEQGINLRINKSQKQFHKKVHYQRVDDEKNKLFKTWSSKKYPNTTERSSLLYSKPTSSQDLRQNSAKNQFRGKYYEENIENKQSIRETDQKQFSFYSEEDKDERKNLKKRKSSEKSELDEKIKNFDQVMAKIRGIISISQHFPINLKEKTYK